jgi:predicted RNase H-like HicB family nuclease
MLTLYIQNALKKAHYKILSDNEGYYGWIDEFQGVWANAETLEECREQLHEVLEEWLLLSFRRKTPIYD